MKKGKQKPKQNMIGIIVIVIIIFFFYTFQTAMCGAKCLAYVMISSHSGFAIPHEVGYNFRL